MIKSMRSQHTIRKHTIGTDMCLLVRTTEPNTEVVIQLADATGSLFLTDPTVPTSGYKLHISYSDGATEVHTTNANISHTFATVGVHRIRLRGCGYKFLGLCSGQLISIVNIGNLKSDTEFDALFENNQTLRSVRFGTVNEQRTPNLRIDKLGINNPNLIEVSLADADTLTDEALLVALSNSPKLKRVYGPRSWKFDSVSSIKEFLCNLPLVESVSRLWALSTPNLVDSDVAGFMGTTRLPDQASEAALFAMINTSKSSNENLSLDIHYNPIATQRKVYLQQLRLGSNFHSGELIPTHLEYSNPSGVTLTRKIVDTNTSTFQAVNFDGQNWIDIPSLNYLTGTQQPKRIYTFTGYMKASGADQTLYDVYYQSGVGGYKHHMCWIKILANGDLYYSLGRPDSLSWLPGIQDSCRVLAADWNEGYQTLRFEHVNGQHIKIYSNDVELPVTGGFILYATHIATNLTIYDVIGASNSRINKPTASDLSNFLTQTKLNSFSIEGMSLEDVPSYGVSYELDAQTSGTVIPDLNTALGHTLDATVNIGVGSSESVFWGGRIGDGMTVSKALTLGTPTTIKIPTRYGYPYEGYITWGTEDPMYFKGWNHPALYHSLDTDEVLEVVIYGVLGRLEHYCHLSGFYLSKVFSLGNNGVSTLRNAFRECPRLTHWEASPIECGCGVNAVSMEKMFYENPSWSFTPNVTHLQPEACEDVTGMFEGLSGTITYPNLGNWKTPKLKRADRFLSGFTGGVSGSLNCANLELSSLLSISDLLDGGFLNQQSYGELLQSLYVYKEQLPTNLIIDVNTSVCPFHMGATREVLITTYGVTFIDGGVSDEPANTFCCTMNGLTPTITLEGPGEGWISFNEEPFLPFSEADVSNLTYANPSGEVVTIMIEGTLSKVTFEGNQNIIEVSKLGDMGWTSFENMFKDSSVTYVEPGVDLSDDTISVSSTKRMFENTQIVAPMPLDKLNKTSLLDMSYMYSECVSMTSITNLSGKTFTNVTTIEGLFKGSVIETLTMSNASFPSLVSMKDTFNGTIVTTLSLEGTTTGSLTDISGCFQGLDVGSMTFGDLFVGSPLQQMHHVFNVVYVGGAVTTATCWNWDVTRVIDMTGIFQNCPLVTLDVDVSSWVTSSVEVLDYAFAGSITE